MTAEAQRAERPGEGSTMVVVRPHATVLVVSAQPLVRRGLRDLLSPDAGMRVLADCATAAEGVSLAARLRPDVLVLDAGPRASDLAVPAGSAVRMVVLAPAADRARVTRAVRSRAAAVLDRDADPRRLLQAVRVAARGVPASGPVRSRPSLPPLTRREFEVLELVGHGASNLAVAEQLGISCSTVKFHVRALLGKLGGRNRTDIAVLAVRYGLV